MSLVRRLLMDTTTNNHSCQVYQNVKFVLSSEIIHFLSKVKILFFRIFAGAFKRCLVAKIFLWKKTKIFYLPRLRKTNDSVFMLPVISIICQVFSFICYWYLVQFYLNIPTASTSRKEENSIQKQNKGTQASYQKEDDWRWHFRLVRHRCSFWVWRLRWIINRSP